MRRARLCAKLASPHTLSLTSTIENMKKEIILKSELEIEPTEIRWCFISDYYDGPVEGLLYYKNKVWKFCCFREDIPEQSIYVILKLSENEIKKEMEAKRKFEEMVGTHWSYDESRNNLPESGATSISSKKYYESKEKEDVVTPFSHQIEAWFNVSRKSA